MFTRDILFKFDKRNFIQSRQIDHEDKFIPRKCYSDDDCSKDTTLDYFFILDLSYVAEFNSTDFLIHTLEACDKNSSISDNSTSLITTTTENFLIT